MELYTSHHQMPVVLNVVSTRVGKGHTLSSAHGRCCRLRRLDVQSVLRFLLPLLRGTRDAALPDIRLHRRHRQGSDNATLFSLLSQSVIQKRTVMWKRPTGMPHRRSVSEVNTICPLSSRCIADRQDCGRRANRRSALLRWAPSLSPVPKWNVVVRRHALPSNRSIWNRVTSAFLASSPSSDACRVFSASDVQDDIRYQDGWIGLQRRLSREDPHGRGLLSCMSARQGVLCLGVDCGWRVL